MAAFVLLHAAVTPRALPSALAPALGPAGTYARVSATLPSDTRPRRRAVLQGGAALCAGIALHPAAAAAGEDAAWLPLGLYTGELGYDSAGGWEVVGSNGLLGGGSVGAEACVYSETFLMYLARFLIAYDDATAAWWESAVDRLPAVGRERADSSVKGLRQQLGLLGSLGASLRFGLANRYSGGLENRYGGAGEMGQWGDGWWGQGGGDGREAASVGGGEGEQREGEMEGGGAAGGGTGEGGAAAPAALFLALQGRYGQRPGARGQLALLFSALPPGLQPVTEIDNALGRPHTPAGIGRAGGAAEGAAAGVKGSSSNSGLAESAAATLRASATALPPPGMLPIWDAATGCYSLPPALGAAGSFGGLGRSPAQREGVLQRDVYGKMAVAGAVGCAITHLAVVPLDVVKTRLQTRPSAYTGLADAARTIAREEGVGMLLQGSAATVAGYSLYGVSVYPGYEIWKRVLLGAVSVQDAADFRVPLVLLAGALATTFTCFLITPFEAVRIRMVEQPEYASSLGEALRRYTAAGGIPALYDGLVPLLVRQVLFGMVKFLVFDYCADAIFALLQPSARADVLTSAAVSLASGAVAGTAAAVFSQPADVILSKVAQGASCETADEGVLPGAVNQWALLGATARTLIREHGLSGLYLGLGSRVVWSGAIIAGQFLLYDVFKDALHVAASDLALFYDALAVALPSGGT